MTPLDHMQQAMARLGPSAEAHSEAAFTQSDEFHRATAWSDLRPLVVKTAAIRRPLTRFRADGEPGDFLALRARVLQQAESRNWRRIGITAPRPTRASSHVAFGLAKALARQAERNDMLLDLDLARTALAERFGSVELHGIAEVLTADCEFDRQALLALPNLAVALNYTPRDRAGDVLMSPLAHRILAQISTIYAPNLMLCHLPPILDPDAGLAALGQMDAVILVGELGHTRLEDIDHCEKEIAVVSNVMGVVLQR